MQRGRCTIAAQQRRKKSGRRVMPRTAAPAQKRARPKKETPMTARERRQMVQVLVCGAIFVALVAVKLLAPGRMGPLREKAVSLMEQNMDVQAVFSAVGRAFSGEGEAEEIYQAVFREEPAAPVSVSLTVSGRTTALELLHTYRPEEAQEEETLPGVFYDQENLPEGVSMEQAILGFDYCTPVAGTLTSSFGYREHPIEGEDLFHYGIDLAANTGTAIVCFADGTVGAVGESSSYGKYCIVNHDSGFATLYAHCDSITVASGTAVKRGETIAKVGATGMATGSHLHFELHQNGIYLNPIYYVSYTAQV